MTRRIGAAEERMLVAAVKRRAEELLLGYAERYVDEVGTTERRVEALQLLGFMRDQVSKIRRARAVLRAAGMKRKRG